MNVQKLAGKSGQTSEMCLSALSGEVSPRLREELEKRGMTVRDRLVPGTAQVISTRQRP